MAQLNAALANFFTQWPDDAVLSLIENRRRYQHEFTTTRIHDQKRLWNRIARNINNDHPQFAPTRKQCRTKWNALKSGYENLKRLMDGNPQGFPTHTPTLHDERFHEELSDEFWLVECNYLLFN
jgi:Myb/SANT-like DNA-binding domain